MSVDVVQLTLDYDSLDSDTLAFVQELDAELDLVLKRTAKDLGRIFEKAKNGLPHGMYMSWLASKGISQPTAWRCMQVWQGKEVKSFKMNDLDVEVVEQPVEPVQQVKEVGSFPTNEAKRDTVKKFFEDFPHLHALSNREIARRCGVDHKTVAAIRKELFPEPEPEPEPIVEPVVQTIPEPKKEVAPEPEQPMNFEPEPTPEPAPKLMEEPESEQLQVLPEPQEVADPLPERQEEGAKKSASLSALQSSKSNEWYTPMVYIEAARKLMGDIDLDPASCEESNRIVQARRYYTEEDDGLAWDWWFDEDEQIPARVFLNPPYGFGEEGKSNQEIWSHRLAGQYEMGFVSEAVLLVNANTEAKWFHLLYDYLICFTDHRIRFWNRDGEENQPTQGNAFIYFGPREKKAKFIELFSRFGVVMERAK